MTSEQYDDLLAASTWSAANVSTDPVVTFPYTGDYRIDTLIGGADTRWNSASPMGTPVTVSYSFMSSRPVYGGTDDGTNWGFSSFNTAQRTAVKQIFAQLQTELNIKFVEVSDSFGSYGQIRFGNNYQSSSSGYSWLPNTAGDQSGDVWLDAATYSNTYPTQGTQGWDTLIHEIGHALGLKHPGNYNAGSVAQAAPGNYLGSAQDNLNFTVMSYYDAAGGQPRNWYGEFDLLALKTLYGANAGYNAGATTYRYTDTSGASLSIIDDASGSDTIDLSALSIKATVDLHAGAFSSIGWNHGVAAVNNLSIDLNTTVENVVGTAFADVVRGNDANNRLTLGTGNNVADGAGGIDTAVYQSTRAAVSASVSADGVVHVAGVNLNDSLTGIERLEFSDLKLAFDLGGAAGTVAKTIGAVFGSAQVANAAFEGIGLGLADAGVGATELMQYALNAKLGAGATNEAVVDLLYGNVIGHAPSSVEAAPFVGMLGTSSLSQAALGTIAADCAANCANVDLVGLTAHGVVYA